MEQAANLGNIGAKNRLAHIYEHGLYGVHMDMAKAFHYYQEAVNQGQHLQSMLGLSRLYNGGCHGPNDSDEHLRMANDVSGWLVATPKDEDQSFYWCQRCAKSELPDGLYLLG
jgi:TPR repeat protein